MPDTAPPVRRERTGGQPDGPAPGSGASEGRATPGGESRRRTNGAERPVRPRARVPLSRRSYVPLYHQIEAHLRARIGTLQPGDAVPSERELAETFGVSRMTARQALEHLVAAGLLYRETGRGSFVGDPRVEKDFSGLTSFTEDMRRRGLRPGSRVLAQRVEPADEGVAASLALAAGAPVLLLHRLRLADGLPVSVDRVWLPLALVPGLEDEDLSAGSLWARLEARYDLRLAVARGALAAVAATAEDAALLGVPAGSALLVARRVAYSERHEPVEYGETRYRGDRYTFPIVQRRPKAPWVGPDAPLGLDGAVGSAGSVESVGSAGSVGSIGVVRGGRPGSRESRSRHAEE